MNPLLLRRRCMAHNADVDYSKRCLTIVSLADNNTITWADTFTIATKRYIRISTDGGATWSGSIGSSNEGVTLATLQRGEKMMVKTIYDTVNEYSYNGEYAHFTSSSSFALEGNIMSLLYQNDFWNFTGFSENSSYTFLRMFAGCTGLVDISNLVMPATTLVQGCYERMFQGTGITSLPENLLPATTLSPSCYYYMFYGCPITAIPSGFLPATTVADSCYYSMFSNTSITTLPSGLLPATTLAASCYRQMFYGCASLATVASDLMGATTLASACCRGMFSACSSLQNSPDLLAQTLVTDCYRVMFNACTSITYIKCTATSISASNATNAWLGGASSRGTFVRAAGVSWARSTSGIPSGWTIQNA